MKLLLFILQLTLALAAKYRSLDQEVAVPQLAVTNKTQVADDVDSDDLSDSDEALTDDAESDEDEDAEPADAAFLQEDEEEDEEDEDDEDVPELTWDDEDEDLMDAEVQASLAVEKVDSNETLDFDLQSTSIKKIPGIGKVLIKTIGTGKKKQKWVLLMKLSKNQFCEDSRRWTDGVAYNGKKMFDTKFPRHQEYDAKSIAFHELDGIDAVKLQTNTVKFGEAPEVHFKFPSTAETLMTTNSVDIIGTGDFNTWKYWKLWSKAFQHSRNRAPAFMRAKRFVQSVKPQCRTNPQDRPSGCGKPCMFCMQAGDGGGCPVRSAHNDISKGIGLSRHFCGGGNGHDCSSSGNWAGDRRTLVWGRMRPGAKRVFQTFTMDYGGDVLVRNSGGETWALVMKLSKNDFCHGSPRWTDGAAFKPEKMFDTRFPNREEYDAKSLAFHKLDGVTAIKIQTNRQNFKSAVTVEFDAPGTPEKLITSNKIKISPKGGFNKKTWWKTWEAQYGRSRQRAPAFMRDGKFVRDPAPECRTNPQDKPSGCGKECVFCMQAGDGSGCPARSAHNDISVGIGLSAAFCGGGNRKDCSSSGNWVGDSRTFVWAKWSCEKHGKGQCKGTRHFGTCGDLEVDDCDTHYVHVMTDEKKLEGAFLQCSTVDGQCVSTGPACYGSCKNAFAK